MNQSRFTGHERKLRNRTVVKVLDHVSRWLITVGGIGTIISVMAVCVFLIWVVLPLFLPARIDEPVRSGPGAVAVSGVPLRLAVNEFRELGWMLEKDGTLSVFRLDTGKRLEERRLFTGPALTAASFRFDRNEVAFGFQDGSVRLGTIGFETRFLEPDEVTGPMKALAVDASVEAGGGLVVRTPEGRYRLETVGVKLEAPFVPQSPAPVLLIDQTLTNMDETLYASLTADGKLRVNVVVKNEFLDELTLTTGELDLGAEVRAHPPQFLKISGIGSAVYLVWKDGRVHRYDTRNPEKPFLVEKQDLVHEDGVEVTAIEWLVGRATLLVGDSRGRVTGWFLTRPEGMSSAEQLVLTEVHHLPAGEAPVTAIASSARTRMIAVGYADGEVALMLVTTATCLARTRTDPGAPLLALALGPLEDGLVGLTATAIHGWNVELRHPEASLTALFSRVWYEGYNEPRYVWQSSSGTDDFETKLSLVPLIFGTLKATLYSLLFGVPLALLAAIYTSEFMHPRMRSVIKPTVELMASLPSVVLGFLAGLVFAPFVENVVPATLSGFFTIPVAFLVGAYLWQLIPQPVALRFAGWRFPLVCAALPLGVVGGIALGPVVERILFAGNIKAWLDGQRGSGTGGWFLILLPLAALATAVLMGTRVNPWFRHATAGMPRGRVAMFDILRFLAGVVIAAGLSLAVSLALTGLGMDPRGSLVGTYVQRNALVVGFVMGFAIIPIIYTLSEDALSTIPEHLRSASLGAGATPWQTATRIVIPTAMSGLFSAIMIGLGRAVGETMVVLMAAGNTPVMDWNMFNGFRTLSANIAVELPEAVRNSTHYRTLFLAALTLFAITFVLNTVAEIVRLRFRRRSYEL